MRSKCLCLLVLCILGGCPGPEEEFQLPADRLAVTDALRLACDDFAPTDADIEALIILAESDRLAGVAKREAIAGVMLACGQWDAPADLPAICIRCCLAIVEQVYGP